MNILTVISLSLLFLTQFSWSAADHPKGGSEEPLQAIVRPFKLTDEAGKFEFEIRDDGTFVHNEQDLGKIHGTGIVYGKDGKELARLKDNGEVRLKDGRTIGKVLANGDIKLPDQRAFSWQVGTLKFGPDGPSFTIVPPELESKRVAALVLLLFFTS